MKRSSNTISHNTPSASGTPDAYQASHGDFEPYVSVDEIASFIDEPRRNVIRMAREGKLTCYQMSGSKRHTYKFKRSEISKDFEKLRRPSVAASEDPSMTRDASN